MRVSKFIIWVTLTAAIPASPANAADWPDLFAKAVAAKPDLKQVFSYETSNIDGEGKENFRYRFDPDQTPRFEVLSASEDMNEKRQAERLKRLEEEGDDIWCDDMADRVKGDVRTVKETPKAVTYAFTPTDPEADDMERKMIERTQATVTVDRATQTITDFTFTLLEPFKPIFIARVHSFDLKAECEPAPNGRPYFKTLTIDVDVSAMGKRQQQTNVQTTTLLDHPEN